MTDENQTAEPTEGAALEPCLSARIETWLAIATRQAASPLGYKLYPGDRAALASVLKECKRNAEI